MPDNGASVNFDDYVREVEQDPDEKALLDAARERLRRDLGEGDEEAHVR